MAVLRPVLRTRVSSNRFLRFGVVPWRALGLPMPVPQWIKPQLSKLATKAPSGPQWIHEIKYDGYRMAAWIDRGKVKLLTRSGLDWTANSAGSGLMA